MLQVANIRYDGRRTISRRTIRSFEDGTKQGEESDVSHHSSHPLLGIASRVAVKVEHPSKQNHGASDSGSNRILEEEVKEAFSKHTP